MNLSHGGTAARLAHGRVLPFADGREGADGIDLTLGIRPGHMRPVLGGMVLTVRRLRDPDVRALVDGTALAVKLSGGSLNIETLDVMPEAAFPHGFDAKAGLCKVSTTAKTPVTPARAE